MKIHITIWSTLLFLLFVTTVHAAKVGAGVALPFEDVPQTVFSSLSGSFLYYTLLIGALILLWAWGHNHHGAILGQIIGFLVLAALATHLEEVATAFKWSGALC